MPQVQDFGAHRSVRRAAEGGREGAEDCTSKSHVRSIDGLRAVGVGLIRHRCNTMVCRVAPKGGDAKGGRKASEEKSGHSTAKAGKQPCSKSATVGCKMCEKQVGCSHCKPICVASGRLSANLRGRIDLLGATPLFEVGRMTQVQPENLVDVYCGCPRDNLCAARPSVACESRH